MPDPALIVAGVIGSILVFGVILVLIIIPKGKQVEVLAEPGVPFEMRCSPQDDRTYRLWTRYNVHWTEGGKNGFGVVFDLRIAVNDHIVSSEPFGLGHGIPDGVERRFIRSEMFVSDSSAPSGYQHSATVKLVDLGRRPRNSEITVSGMVRPGPGSSLEPTKLYIAR